MCICSVNQQVFKCDMGTGRNIRAIRLGLGWKLKDLAERAEVEIGTLSALESRDSSKSDYFLPIAKAFGMTVEDLTTWTPGGKKVAQPVAIYADPTRDPTIAEVVRLMQATDNAGRSIALGAVRFALRDHIPQKTKTAA
jgi:transcriptional regulator with XRE-family HTH domain